jgi:hypothetical protein
MTQPYIKQIDKDTYISVDPASKNGDYGCKATYKIIDEIIYMLDIEYFKGDK